MPSSSLLPNKRSRSPFWTTMEERINRNGLVPQAGHSSHLQPFCNLISIHFRSLAMRNPFLFSLSYPQIVLQPHRDSHFKEERERGARKSVQAGERAARCHHQKRRKSWRRRRWLLPRPHQDARRRRRPRPLFE